jgi:hypothetical protein
MVLSDALRQWFELVTALDRWWKFKHRDTERWLKGDKSLREFVSLSLKLKEVLYIKWDVNKGNNLKC